MAFRVSMVVWGCGWRGVGECLVRLGWVDEMVVWVEVEIGG